MFAVRIIRGTWNTFERGFEIYWKYQLEILLPILLVFLVALYYQCGIVDAQRESFNKDLNRMRHTLDRMRHTLDRMSQQLQSFENACKQIKQVTSESNLYDVPIHDSPGHKFEFAVTYNGVLLDDIVTSFQFPETGLFSITALANYSSESDTTGNIEKSVGVGFRIYRKNDDFPPGPLLECVTSNSDTCSAKNTWLFNAGDEIYLEHYDSSSGFVTEPMHPPKTTVGINLTPSGDRIQIDYITL